MTTDMPLTDDPFGYRHDLELVLAYPTPAAPNPVPVVLALARCVTFGVSVSPALAERARRWIPTATGELLADITAWTTAGRTLGERYDATDDPWEADGLIRVLIERRVTAHGLEAIAPDVFGDAVEEFDATLRDQSELIGSASGSPWFENLRLDLPPDTVADSWWLNPTPDTPELPPAEYLAVVRRVAFAKSLLRVPTEASALAAAIETGEPTPPPTSIRWKSPDGRGEARLNFPATPTNGDEVVPRPLKLYFDGQPLASTPVRLGNVTGTTAANGLLLLSLADLRPNWDGRLFVGIPEVEWPIVLSDQRE